MNVLVNWLGKQNIGIHFTERESIQIITAGIDDPDRRIFLHDMFSKGIQFTGNTRHRHNEILTIQILHGEFFHVCETVIFGNCAAEGCALQLQKLADAAPAGRSINSLKQIVAVPELGKCGTLLLVYAHRNDFNFQFGVVFTDLYPEFRQKSALIQQRGSDADCGFRGFCQRTRFPQGIF